MSDQELVDKAEAEAIKRFNAMRQAFGPCWGARGRSLVKVRKPRRKPALVKRDR